MAEERMEEEVKQDTSETETQENGIRKNVKKLRRLPQKIQKPRKMGKLLRKKIKKASFPEEKKRKRKMP